MFLQSLLCKFACVLLLFIVILFIANIQLVNCISFKELNKQTIIQMDKQFF